MIQARTNPGHKAQSDRADVRAAELAPILTKLQASGITSSGALAVALTAPSDGTAGSALRVAGAGHHPLVVAGIMGAPPLSLVNSPRNG
jgi:hypothetical protein